MSDRKTMNLDRHLAWVVPQNGPLEGCVYPVEDGCTLGAGERVNVQLRGYQQVAPAHAKVSFTDGWALHALGGNAADGGKTRVSDRDVPAGGRAALADGEPIELGSLRLIFKCL